MLTKRKLRGNEIGAAGEEDLADLGRVNKVRLAHTASFLNSVQRSLLESQDRHINMKIRVAPHTSQWFFMFAICIIGNKSVSCFEGSPFVIEGAFGLVADELDTFRRDEVPSVFCYNRMVCSPCSKISGNLDCCMRDGDHFQSE